MRYKFRYIRYIHRMIKTISVTVKRIVVILLKDHTMATAGGFEMQSTFTYKVVT